MRDSAVVVTKLFHSVEGDPADAGLALERISRCVEASLGRLGLERLPLYMTHRPDPSTRVADTLAELERQVTHGAVGAYGARNIGADELSAALDASNRLGLNGFGWVQNSYNQLECDDARGVLSICV